VDAAVDVGTNTVRLLLGEARDGKIDPKLYFRKITRLGGGMTPGEGLATQAIGRTLHALEEVVDILRREKILRVRAVGTAALRLAVNGPRFLEMAREVGVSLEIINGDLEAQLSARGVLAALHPRPGTSLIFDIGGGSTEFILWHGGEVLFHRSFPLGVVVLTENFSTTRDRTGAITELLDQLEADLEPMKCRELLRNPACLLAGTAGTVTTLAALKLKMRTYDWRKVNNQVLTRDDLQDMMDSLERLAVAEREELPGIEKGRGDLILPGLQFVLAILDRFDRTQLTVSDFGLLEGILLSMANGR
jgi:exopolyphosphatase/guanosine-5'-triphosphate,3'-diphosphate pyrophosphatase